MNDGRIVEAGGVELDNRYVVPYNQELLLMFRAHINVEKCNQSTAIKYLFKYISKGNDRVVASILSSKKGSLQHQFDEVQQYYNCRYIFACESAWRLFGFDIHHRFPPVILLSFHLPNEQSVIYSSASDVSSLLLKPRVCESQFLSWMKLNSADAFAASLTYIEIPQHYVYQKASRKWQKRKRKTFAIGRITNASLGTGELFYLRLLLTKVRGPTCFADIQTVDGRVYDTFRAACDAMGLLDDDQEFINAIAEAANWATGIALRKLFVSMLISGSIQRPAYLWSKCSRFLSEDLFYIPHAHPNYSGFSPPLNLCIIYEFMFPNIIFQLQNYLYTRQSKRMKLCDN